MFINIEALYYCTIAEIHQYTKPFYNTHINEKLIYIFFAKLIQTFQHNQNL